VGRLNVERTQIEEMNNKLFVANDT